MFIQKKYLPVFKMIKEYRCGIPNSNSAKKYIVKISDPLTSPFLLGGAIINGFLF